jgi:hypothetical protein
MEINLSNRFSARIRKGLKLSVTCFKFKYVLDVWCFGFDFYREY